MMMIDWVWLNCPPFYWSFCKNWKCNRRL